MSTPYQNKIQKRVSLASSSSLSTRTKTILKRLQGSPIKTTGAPPKTLGQSASRPKKTSTIKTRLQMLAMRTRCQPYWTDLIRSQERKQKEANTVPGTAEMDDIEIIETVVVEKTAILKQPTTKTRNFFSAKELEDEEEDAVVPVAPPPGVFTFDPPRCFTFDPPKQLSKPVDEANTTTSESSSIESCGSDENSESSSSNSDVEIISSKESSPSKSSEKSEEPLAPLVGQLHEEFCTHVPDSTTTAAPKPVEWTCPTCFVQNTGEACVCCATAKDGTPGFVPTLSTNIPEVKNQYSFGFGTSVKAPENPAKSVAPASSTTVEHASTTAAPLSVSSFPSASSNTTSAINTAFAKAPKASSQFSFGIKDNVASVVEKSAPIPPTVIEKASTTAAAPLPVSIFSSNSSNPFGYHSLQQGLVEKPSSQEVSAVSNPSVTTTTPAANPAEWICQTCFVSNTGEACVCCATAKNGTSRFVPTLSTNIPEVKNQYSFGFGTSAKAQEKPAESVATLASREKPPTAAPSSAPAFPKSFTNLFGSASAVNTPFVKVPEAPSQITFGTSAKAPEKPAEPTAPVFSPLGGMLPATAAALPPVSSFSSNLSNIFESTPAINAPFQQAPEAPNQLSFGINSDYVPATKKRAPILYPDSEKASTTAATPLSFSTFTSNSLNQFGSAPAVNPFSFDKPAQMNFNFGAPAAPDQAPFVFKSNTTQAEDPGSKRTISAGARKMVLAKRRLRK